MIEIIQTYQLTINAFGAMALLMFIQLVIADIIGIKSKRIPGSVIETDHKNLLFRVSRTVANTNESIAIYTLAVLYCIFSGAAPVYTAFAAWSFVIARFLYALCYYFNQKLFRSILFGVSLICIAALLVIGFIA